MNSIKVSGCIVTYNNAEIIEDCIESIFRETKGIDFHLFVSDNHSSDDTVQRIRDKFPEVEIIQNLSNEGFGQGHNKVIDMLDSQYHVIINPDIKLCQDVITELVKYMEENPLVGQIGPKVVNNDGTEQHLPKRDPSIRYVILSKFMPFRHYRRKYTREEEHLKDVTRVDSCSGCFFVIRTDVFKKLRGFDKRFFMYCEDADLSRRVRQNWELIFYPYCQVIHDWKRDNTGSIKGVFIFLRSLIKYFVKWRKEIFDFLHFKKKKLTK